jgi:hypothetical protein
MHRIETEKQTIKSMISLYCRKQHRSGDICKECQELMEYAILRLDRCVFGNQKSICAKCPVHCYKPVMREKIRMVMRFSGPRMILYHPIMALQHYLDQI